MFIWCIRKPAVFAEILVKLVPAAVATDASLANQLVCTLPETHIAMVERLLSYSVAYLQVLFFFSGRVS